MKLLRLTAIGSMITIGRAGDRGRHRHWSSTLYVGATGGDQGSGPDRRPDRAAGRPGVGFTTPRSSRHGSHRFRRRRGRSPTAISSTRIPVDFGGQLGELARTFNEMQRRLAELDNARKQFIANASHELRTPIFSLGGFVELLEDEDPSPEERAEFVHTMRLADRAADEIDGRPARPLPAGRRAST